MRMPRLEHRQVFWTTGRKVSMWLQMPVGRRCGGRSFCSLFPFPQWNKIIYWEWGWEGKYWGLKKKEWTSHVWRRKSELVMYECGSWMEQRNISGTAGQEKAFTWIWSEIAELCCSQAVFSNMGGGIERVQSGGCHQGEVLWSGYDEGDRQGSDYNEKSWTGAGKVGSKEWGDYRG